jgi:hypothetical protein
MHLKKTFKNSNYFSSKKIDVDMKEKILLTSMNYVKMPSLNFIQLSKVKFLQKSPHLKITHSLKNVRMNILIELIT